MPKVLDRKKKSLATRKKTILYLYVDNAVAKALAKEARQQGSPKSYILNAILRKVLLKK